MSSQLLLTTSSNTRKWKCKENAICKLTKRKVQPLLNSVSKYQLPFQDTDSRLITSTMVKFSHNFIFFSMLNLNDLEVSHKRYK